MKSKKGAIETIAAVVALAISMIIIGVVVALGSNLTSSTNVTAGRALTLTTGQRSLFSSSYTLLLVGVIAAIGAVAIGAFMYMK